MTSGPGKNSGTSADQRNALQLTFDGTTNPFVIDGTLVDPASDITAPFQQKAIFLGSDQNNYVKLEVERRNDPNGTYLSLIREIDGANFMVGRVLLADPSAVTRLRLRLTATPATGAIEASYAIGGPGSSGAFQVLGSTTVPENRRSRLFSNQAKAGILTSHTAPAGVTNAAVLARWDAFAVTKPSAK